MSKPVGSEEQRGDQNEESNEPNVSSANKWESVDLGDDDRKKKFLRLMGASKKSHQGPIVIGEQESSKREVAGSHSVEINQELEHQFAESLEHKLSGGARAHLGLGFHDNDKETQGETGDIHYKVQPAEKDEREKKDLDKTEEDKDHDKGDEKGRERKREHEHRERREGEGDRERARSRSPVHHRHHHSHHADPSHHRHHHHHGHRHSEHEDKGGEHRRRSLSEGDGARGGPQEQPKDTAKSKYAMAFVKSSS